MVGLVLHEPEFVFIKERLSRSCLSDDVELNLWVYRCTILVIRNTENTGVTLVTRYT